MIGLLIRTQFLSITTQYRHYLQFCKKIYLLRHSNILNFRNTHQAYVYFHVVLVWRLRSKLLLDSTTIDYNFNIGWVMGSQTTSIIQIVVIGIQISQVSPFKADPSPTFSLLLEEERWKHRQKYEISRETGIAGKENRQRRREELGEGEKGYKFCEGKLN